MGRLALVTLAPLAEQELIDLEDDDDRLII
jgi:hypothetical protein